MRNRREFIVSVTLGTGALMAAGQAFAAGPMVSETDPQAIALGYKADTTQVDGKKYPNHKPEQKCANCALYQAKASDPAGGCSLFPGKQVAGAGWCSAYVKRA
ncbi:MAG: high-potential iron-sulfur protein [Tepidimonas sp.]|uniref:high-potential iron-sulfur protein n=1 Tax=Tepidimonas sp. TaxID=2002775 RepID=UPI004054B1A9